MEWDGWGWVGQTPMMFPVFDSTDSLSLATAREDP